MPAASQSQSQSPGPQSFQGQSQGGGMASGVSLFVPGADGPGNRWPAEFGTPSSVGAQNDIRYACFPAARRLAIQLRGGEVRVFDTLDHQISGFSQQQSGDASLTFTSQCGAVRVADLPRVKRPASESAPASPQAAALGTGAAPAPALPAAVFNDDDVIFARIERLAELKQKGILTEDEFAAKKAGLLARL